MAKARPASYAGTMTQHRGIPSTRPARLSMLAACGFAGVLAWVGSAHAAEVSAWVESAQSRARLIDAGLTANGATLLAGIEISLAPQFITYWRDPGDAGVPPTFNFEGSANLAAAEIRYPAPERLDEAGAIAFGYEDDVVFPLIVTPADPAKPVRLRVRIDYAACHAICLLARADLTGTLDGRASAEAGRVRDALAAVPRPDSVGGRGGPVQILAVRPDRDGFSVDARVGEGRGTLFVEAPEGWTYAAGAGVPSSSADAAPSGAAPEGVIRVFSVKLLDRPKGTGLPDRPVVLTLVAPAGAIEVPVELDVGAPKR